MKPWSIGLVCGLCLLALGAAQPQTLKTQEIEIQAVSLDMDLEKGVAHLSENVRLTTEDGTIAADKMDVTFDEQGALVSLTATGHVHIKVKTVTKEKVERHIDARGDAATYEQKARLLTLKGNVTGKIVEPARKRTIDLTSKVASIWLDENRVRLEGGTVTITQPKETTEPAPAKQ